MVAHRHTPLRHDQLDGWTSDDHVEALDVNSATADAIGPLAPVAPCGPRRRAARAFFETAFRPVVTGDPAEALFTGYYEPELQGARERSRDFQVPLYRTPPAGPAGLPARED
jgi:membrane-bound lytic murein transglycosylase A